VVVAFSFQNGDAMSPRTGTKPETTPERTSSLLHTDFVAVLAACVIGALLCAVLIREPVRIDQMTVNNPTDYELIVQARGGPDQAWMPLVVLAPGATASMDDVIDQGGTWTFRLAGQGEDAGTFDVSRDQLRDAGWRLAIPPTIGDQLRVRGIPPTPQAAPAAT